MLCFILALYAFAVFGYITAAIATFFVGRDAENDEGELAGAKTIEALRKEIAALRADIQTLSRQKTELRSLCSTYILHLPTHPSWNQFP